MASHAGSFVRAAPAIALLLAFFVAPVANAPGAAAQEPPAQPAADGGWTAWHGCWEAAEADPEEAEMRVCFEPLADEAGVEIRTSLDGELLGVERMLADGSASPIEEGGCAGERTAIRSGEGARVFIRSWMDCAEGVRRTTRGVMAMEPGGSGWLEIHSVSAGEREGVVGVQRFVPVEGEEASLSVRTARTAARDRLDVDDVLEVVAEADADVARALVAEAGLPFDLDGQALRDMKDRGMPADVIDVMVAVTYPERFEIAGGSWEAREAPTSARARRPYAAAPAPWGYGAARYRGFYRRGYHSPWYGAWGAPRVIVVQPTVRERGRRDDPRPGDRTATRRGASSSDRNPPARNAPPPTRTRRDPPDASNGDRRSGSSSGGSGRTATRRGGGGGGDG